MKSILVALSLILFVTSCQKECKPGFEGSGCKTLSKDKFLGAWNFNMGTIETKCNWPVQHDLSMYRDSVSITSVSGDESIIHIAGNYGEFNAQVNGDRFTIEDTNHLTGEIYSGEGFMTIKRLALHYTRSINCIDYSGSGEFNP